MTISLNLLTMGRSSAVLKTVGNNLAVAGKPIDEVVWCDNGSDWSDFSQIRDALAAHKAARGFRFTHIRHDENRGVAPGYNRCAALSTCDLIAITGCDRMMPPGWLADMVDLLSDPSVAVVCAYSSSSEEVRKRYLGDEFTVRGHVVVPALPMEARVLRRSLLRDAGYLREDFGLYGWEDVEWGNRVLRVCRERGWRSLAMPGIKLENLGNEGHANPEEYQGFKNKQAEDPAKAALCIECRKQNYPFYSPY